MPRFASRAPYLSQECPLTGLENLGCSFHAGLKSLTAWLTAFIFAGSPLQRCRCSGIPRVHTWQSRSTGSPRPRRASTRPSRCSASRRVRHAPRIAVVLLRSLQRACWPGHAGHAGQAGGSGLHQPPAAARGLLRCLMPAVAAAQALLYNLRSGSPWLTCATSMPPLQERSVPADVLELPQKGDRIAHFAWEPHVRCSSLHPQMTLFATLVVATVSVDMSPCPERQKSGL